MDALILIRTVVTLLSWEQSVTPAPNLERVERRLSGTPSHGAIGEVAVSADTGAAATPRALS